MNIAVIDAGGNLKAFARMDGAFLGSIDISLKKAKTAREFNMSSKELGDLAQPGKPLYGIEVTNGGLAIFGGGELIRDKSGTIIGAVGVSGSSVEDDMAVFAEPAPPDFKPPGARAPPSSDAATRYRQFAPCGLARPGDAGRRLQRVDKI